MKRTTPENITSLAPNEIFVFGSNLCGEHSAGAAKTALDKFGAVYGQGEGLQGQSYAFPTLDQNLNQISERDRDWFVTYSRNKLYYCAKEHPELIFLVTKVGCGLAGYPESYMKSFFTDPPSNVILPKGWGE